MSAAFSLRQNELAEWQRRNFGTPSIAHVTLGIAEECGEVCHHILKGEQGIRGRENGIDVAQVADGVADTLIYGIQLLTLLGVDAESVIAKTIEQVLARDWKTNPAGDGNPVKS